MIFHFPPNISSPFNYIRPGPIPSSLPMPGYSHKYFMARINIWCFVVTAALISKGSRDPEMSAATVAWPSFGGINIFNSISSQENHKPQKNKKITKTPNKVTTNLNPQKIKIKKNMVDEIRYHNKVNNNKKWQKKRTHSKNAFNGFLWPTSPFWCCGLNLFVSFCGGVVVVVVVVRSFMFRLCSVVFSLVFCCKLFGRRDLD